MDKGMEIKNRELLEIFVEMEQEGQAFYKELANHISDPVVKEFILFMCAEEAGHEDRFKKILEKKGGRKYGWEDNLALRELIDKHIKEGLFPKLDGILERLPKLEGILKALDYALKAEKRAVEFYESLRKSCDDLETEIILIEMESEEKSHRDYIQNLIQDLKKESS